MAAFDADPPLLDMGTPSYFEGTRSSGFNAGSYIAKFNSALELQWCTFLGNAPANPFIKSLEIDAQNRLLITGNVREGSGFPKTILTGANTQNFGGGELDAFVMRFNTNLSPNWASYLGESNQDFGNTIITTANEKIVILGSTYPFNSSSNFPNYKTLVNGVFNQSSFGGQDYDYGDASICTFNFNGKEENFTYLGGSDGESECFAASANKGGNVFLGGKSNSFDFPIPSTANLSTNLFKGTSFTKAPTDNFETDAMIFGLDNNFVSKWSTVFGSNGFDMFWASATFGNYVYYVGTTYGENFPTTSSGDAYCISVSGGSKDGLILRANMTSTSLNVNDNTTKSKKQLNIYPNPANKCINFSLEKSCKEINVFNLTGTLIKKINLTNHKDLQIELNINDLSVGMYLLEIIDNDDVKIIEKFIKE